MNIAVFPGSLNGQFYAPPSKSATHRALLCAGLARGVSRLTHVGLSDDAKATMEGLKAFGANIQCQKDEVRVEGVETPSQSVCQINCQESGSTLRFLIPVAAALGISACFTGKGRLPERTLQPFVEAFSQKGVTIDYSGRLPFSVRGTLEPGEYAISGNVSSQFVTGLLLGLPMLPKPSRIRLTTPLSSSPYVDMTLDLLRTFGAEVTADSFGYQIPSLGRFQPADIRVEGDYSGAAFFLCGAALFGNVLCNGLSRETRQGDRAVLSLLEQFGARVKRQSERVTVAQSQLKGIEINADSIPDLVPILAVIGAFAEGETRILNASRLRLKESDRLSAMAQGLSKMGAEIMELPDALYLKGKKRLPGGCQVDSFSDHRVAMALSVAALGCEKPVEILNAQCVSKSYPEFYQDFISMGGMVHGVGMG